MHPILLPYKSTDSSGHTGNPYMKESLLSEMLSVAHLKCVSYFLNKSNTLKHNMFHQIYPNFVSCK